MVYSEAGSSNYCGLDPIASPNRVMFPVRESEARPSRVVFEASMASES